MVFIVVMDAQACAIARSEAAASARTWPAAKDMIGPDENDGAAHSASQPVWEPLEAWAVTARLLRAAP